MFCSECYSWNVPEHPREIRQQAASAMIARRPSGLLQRRKGRSRMTIQSAAPTIRSAVAALVLLLGFAAAPGARAAQPETLDTAAIDAAIGRAGQLIGDVYKVTFPRSDLYVTIRGVAIKPGLALTGWAAFKAVGSDAVVHGDLALAEAEVNPVVSQLRAGQVE